MTGKKKVTRTLNTRDRVTLIDKLREMAVDGHIDRTDVELAKMGAEKLDRPVSTAMIVNLRKALDITVKANDSSPMSRLCNRVAALERYLDTLDPEWRAKEGA